MSDNDINRLAEARERVRGLDGRIEALWRDMVRLAGIKIAVAKQLGIDLREIYGTAEAVAPLPPPALPSYRETELGRLWVARKIDGGQHEAGQAVARLAALDGRGLAGVWVGDRTGGGGAGADGIGDRMARQMDAHARLGMMGARILLDPRCGDEIEARRRVLAVVHLLCVENLSAKEIARDRPDLGNRKAVERKLWLGLTVVAEALGDIVAHRREARERFAASMADAAGRDEAA